MSVFKEDEEELDILGSGGYGEVYKERTSV
jgi:hypothetical protein